MLGRFKNATFLSDQSAKLTNLTPMSPKHSSQTITKSEHFRHPPPQTKTFAARPKGNGIFLVPPTYFSVVTKKCLDLVLAWHDFLGAPGERLVDLVL